MVFPCGLFPSLDSEGSRTISLMTLQFSIFSKGPLQLVHLEMLNLVTPLRLSAKGWSYSTSKVYSDNLAIVQVVQTGKTRYDIRTLCIINMWFNTANYDITMTIDHIRGKSNNIADLLSQI